MGADYDFFVAACGWCVSLCTWIATLSAVGDLFVMLDLPCRPSETWSGSVLTDINKSVLTDINKTGTKVMTPRRSTYP